MPCPARCAYRSSGRRHRTRNETSGEWFPTCGLAFLAAPGCPENQVGGVFGSHNGNFLLNQQEPRFNSELESPPRALAIKVAIDPVKLFRNRDRQPPRSVTHNEEFVVEILREVGLLTQFQVEQARVKAGAGSLVRELIDQGLITQEDVVRTLAAQNGMEFIDLTTVAPPPDVLQALDVEIAQRYHAVPVAMRDGTLVVAIGDPMDMETADALSFVLNRDIEYVCATPDSIKKSIADFYGTAAESGANGSGDMMLRAEMGDEETTAGDAPIIKLVSKILLEAYNNRASDIHIEPLEKRSARALPHRRRAARRGAPPEEAALVDHRPPQDHDGHDEHRRKARPAGRTHPDEVPGQGTRPARQHRAHHQRRERGHAYSGQILAASRPGGPRFLQRRPGDLRETHHAARRHHPGDRSDRFRQDHHALRLPQLHQPARPQDHHRGRPGRI